MKAVISDIHGNLEALEAVLADIEKLNIKEIICLGDIVGYGPNPVECARLVMARASAGCIMGNHDFAAISMPFGFNSVARDSIEWTKKILAPRLGNFFATRKLWKFLHALPDEIKDGAILFEHASPRDHFIEYIQEKDAEKVGGEPSPKMVDIFSSFEGACFIGHTHVAGVFTGPSEHKRPPEIKDEFVLPKGGAKAIINVGSVGQPRDGDPRASYAVLDGEAVKFRRVEYDCSKTFEKIKKIPMLDNSLGERLLKGK